MDDEPTHEFTDDFYGWITHTELSSTDPTATGEWCATVFGWTLRPPFTTPAGDYHLFAYSAAGGGGIRQTGDSETPGSTPTVHVRNTREAFDAALSAGAEPIAAPETIMPGVCIATVRAPGGVVIGLSGPTD